MGNKSRQVSGSQGDESNDGIQKNGYYGNVTKNEIKCY